MIDDQVERIIQNMLPDLRAGLRAVLSGDSVYAFNAASETSTLTGAKSRVACLVAHEGAALILEATADGIKRSAAYQTAEGLAVIKKLRESSEGGH